MWRIMIWILLLEMFLFSFLFCSEYREVYFLSGKFVWYWLIFASLEFFFLPLLPLKLVIMLLALTVVKVGVIISKITFILKQKFPKSEARFHMKIGVLIRKRNLWNWNGEKSKEAGWYICQFVDMHSFTFVKCINCSRCILLMGTLLVK